MLKCSNPQCTKTFEYAAKKTVSPALDWPDLDNVSSTAKVSFSTNEHVTTETYVCPFCGSLEFQKVTEEPSVPLEDMQMVPFEQVKEFLEKGYVELDRKDHVYAKGLAMIKTSEIKEGEPLE